MIDLDKIQEIFLSLRKHKLRTFLTGFGVAWGIFMLVILLGSGQGLQKGIMSNFSGYASNSMSGYAGVTTMPYKGMPEGRWIRPTSIQLKEMKSKIDAIECVSPKLQYSSGGAIVYKNKEESFSVEGVTADFFRIEAFNPVIGRLINQRDNKEKRKVAIIGKKPHEVLFDKKDPIGEYIRIGQEYFMVIGVFEKESKGFNPFESNIFIPFNSLLNTFSVEDKISQFSLLINPEHSAKEVEEEVRSYLANACSFDVKDRRAIWISNIEEQFNAFNSLFVGIAVFLWIIGISTLVGGIVGVGNIMLVTVKERTKEIGIRKALGATPNSIISFVLQESIIITTLAGYIGMILGMIALKAGGWFVERLGDNSKFIFFKNPEIDLGIAVSATILLICAGALAGYIPARNAAKVDPIEALRYE